MIARPILPSSHEIPAFIFCNHAIRNTLFPEWEYGRIHTSIPPCAHARSCAYLCAVCISSHTPMKRKKDKKDRILKATIGWEFHGSVGGLNR